MPHLKAAKVSVDELLGYLDFEIDKIDLEVKRHEWQSRTNAEELKVAREWLGKLKALREEFASEKLMASTDYIDALTQRLQETFH